MNGFPVDGCHGRYRGEDYRNRFAPACSVKKKNPSRTPVSVEIRSKFMDVSSLIRKGPGTGLGLWGGITYRIAFIRFFWPCHRKKNFCIKKFSIVLKNRQVLNNFSTIYIQFIFLFSLTYISQYILYTHIYNKKRYKLLYILYQLTITQRRSLITIISVYYILFIHF